MELHEFIKATISDILGAVSSINDGRGDFAEFTGGITIPMNRGAPHDTVVKFDVAVTSSSESSQSKGGALRVHVVSLEGDTAISAAESRASRVQFEIPIHFPEPLR